MNEQVKEILELAKKIILQLKNNLCGMEQQEKLYEEIELVIATVNEVLGVDDKVYLSKIKELYRCQNSEEKRREIIKNTEKWIAYVEQGTHLSSNYIDIEFYEFMKKVAEKGYEGLVAEMKGSMYYLLLTDHLNYKRIEIFYNCYSEFWGGICLESEELQLLCNRADILINHRQQLLDTYAILEDYRSKNIFRRILQYWVENDSGLIEPIVERVFRNYFDADIMPKRNRKIYLDVGTDSWADINNFLCTFGDVERVYYCPEQEEFTMESELIERIDKMSVVDADYIKISTASPVLEYLNNYQEMIRQNHPIMSICIARRYTDIWDVWKKILEIDDSYKFYLRYYGAPFCPTEYVLICV